MPYGKVVYGEDFTPAKKGSTSIQIAERGPYRFMCPLQLAISTSLSSSWRSETVLTLIAGLFGRNLARSCWREDIVRCLLQHPSIDVNAVDASSRTSLSWAVIGGHHKAVRFLLDDRDLRTRWLKDD